MEVSGNIWNNFGLKGYNTCLQPVNYTFIIKILCHLSRNFPKCSPVGKNFWNLTKLPEIFSGGFFSRGNFPRETFRDLLNCNTCLQPWICTFKMCNILINSVVSSCSRNRKGSEKFSGSFRKHWNIFCIKVYKRLITAGKLYFLLLKFYGIYPEIFRNVPLSEKISEIWQNCQKYFPGDFSPEEISPGELSGICRSKTHVYSRKIVLFWHVKSL